MSVTLEEWESEQYHREPLDGESYDRAGNIRPVPSGVPNTPEGDA